MAYGVFDVRDFGALGDNLADDTPAFVAAFAAAEALGPERGIVQVPPGDYYTSGIEVPSGVTLTGFGPQSVIRLLDGVDLPVVKNKTSADSFINIRDLRVRGNKFGRGGPNAHGISIISDEDHSVIQQNERFKQHGDPQMRILNVTVDACSGDGIFTWTRALHIDHCLIGHCDGDGLRLQGSDNWVSNTDINWIGRRGLVLEGGANMVSQTKVWFIGIDPAVDDGDGVYVRSSNNALDLYVQDTSRHGIKLHAAKENLINVGLDNIGNLFSAQGIGREYTPNDQVSAIYLDRVGDGNGSFKNKIGFTLGQRSPVSGLDYAVNFRPDAEENQVTGTADAAHIRGGGAMVNPGNATCSDNFAMINNRLV